MLMLLSTTTDNMIGVGVHDVTDDVVGSGRDVGVGGVGGVRYLGNHLYLLHQIRCMV